MMSILYIVATPIGNLKDITFRAVDILKHVDLIACEDTRHTKKLTSHYNINTSLTSYFEHNKFKKSQYIIDLLKQGKSVALVSDAGTPGISDPGYRLIKDAIDNNINIVAIPGASAITTSLSASGMPTDRFIFEGFLPNKTIARKKKLQEYKQEKRTIIFYESPYRVVKSLSDMLDVFGNISVVCARELTKKFEEIKRGKLKDVLDYFKNKTPKGEFVILLNPKGKK